MKNLKVQIHNQKSQERKERKLYNKKQNKLKILENVLNFEYLATIRIKIQAILLEAKI